MDYDGIAVFLAITISIIMFTLYSIAVIKENGSRPHLNNEVYLYYDHTISKSDPEIVNIYNANTATLDQVREYVRTGGSTHGYGKIANFIISTENGKVTFWDAKNKNPAPVGHWLFGPKPRKGTLGVKPFNKSSWFHPKL
jgi:hypothetical protein